MQLTHIIFRFFRYNWYSLLVYLFFKIIEIKDNTYRYIGFEGESICNLKYLICNLSNFKFNMISYLKINIYILNSY